MSMSVLKLSNYDFIGFDLDNTLCQYKLKELITSQYQFLNGYLTKEKHYHGLSDTLTQKDIDFIARGLFIDIDRQNVLKTDKTGLIVRASHGTKPLHHEAICRFYGDPPKWKPVIEAAKDYNSLFQEHNLKVSITLADFTDIVGTLVFAKAVDHGENGHFVWRDVLAGIKVMYSKTHSWYQYFINHLDEFLFKTPGSVLVMISNLQKKAYTAVITSADTETANAVAYHTMGRNWKDMFNFIVYSAHKPIFFKHAKDFRMYRANAPGLTCPKTDFDLSGQYTEGSYHVIKRALTEKLGREPKALYFGDSPFSDLTTKALDRVAIIEESMAEQFFKGYHANSEMLVSEFWGSYFHENGVPTLFGDIVMHTQFCAPNVAYFASKSIIDEHIPFWQENTMFLH